MRLPARALLVASLCLTACPRSAELEAIAVTVTIEAPLAPTCVVLQVRSPDGVVLKTSRAPVLEGRRAYRFGVARGALPERIVLVAEASTGAACDEPQVLIARSGATDTSFPKVVVGQVALLVRCGSSTERCDNGIDDNCDGLSDCADPTCANKTCTDQDSCTLGDVCGGSGCTGTPATCSTPGLCETGTGASCAAGACNYPADVGAVCGSGLLCRSDKSCASGEANCADGLDEDNDGKTDCDDPDCDLQRCDGGVSACSSGARCQTSSCASIGTIACAPRGGGCLVPAGVCMEPSGCAFTALPVGSACDGGSCRADGGCAARESGALCSNGVDDDEDGLTDCADPDCVASQCNDGNACSTGGVCRADGGCAPPVPACSSPPAPVDCYGAPAACGADAGCQYVFQLGAPCNGGLCQNDGGCGMGPAGAFPYVPSNFGPELFAAPDAAVSLGCNNAEINANADGGVRLINWCGGSAQPALFDIVLDGGTPALLAVMPSLTITTNGVLSLTGSRPVILAVYGDATIAGQILARPVSTREAAGSSAAPGRAQQPHCTPGTGGNGATGSGTSAGGGGGAFGSDGARGGNQLAIGATSFGVAGVSGGAPELVPLRGGCAGGNGGTLVNSDPGGAGGGAFQLSVAGVLTISGKVSAPGQGGAGGNVNGNTGGGAGGAGSGGGVLLEAATLSLSPGGLVTAHGGGGGQGDNDPGGGQAGGSGQAGHFLDLSPATGGQSANGPAGGAGATGTVAPVVGTDGASGGNRPGGGGGGGGVGRIRLNVSSACSLDAGAVSPAPTGNCP